MGRFPSIFPVLVLGAVSLFAQSNAAPAADGDKSPAYFSDPKFQSTLSKAREELKRRQMQDAESDYKHANKIAGGACMVCYAGMFDTAFALHEYKDAISAANAEAALAKSPKDVAAANVRLGQALFLQAGEKPKPAQLEAANTAFRTAIQAYPKSPAALYWDGRVLAQLGRVDEAKQQFTACAACMNPKDPARLRAEHFAQDPELSLHKMAPAFEVTALDGAKFNLDAMGGRVVLIDFWATWFGPCNEELPHMKKIAKEFAGEPLVILSISWDSDDAKWKEFVDKNGMTWMQYRDADHKLTDAFGVTAIPHYFTIDSDGVLTSEMVGEGSNVEGRLKKLLAKARESSSPAASVTAAAN